MEHEVLHYLGREGRPTPEADFWAYLSDCPVWLVGSLSWGWKYSQLSSLMCLCGGGLQSAALWKNLSKALVHFGRIVQWEAPVSGRGVETTAHLPLSLHCLLSPEQDCLKFGCWSKIHF